MWNSLPTEQQRLLTAIAGVALAIAYFFTTLVGLGIDRQAAQQERFSELARLRHGIVCENLGRRPSTSEHDACIEALTELQGWHKQLFLEVNGSPL
jgi:hypothetical protein